MKYTLMSEKGSVILEEATLDSIIGGSLPSDNYALFAVEGPSIKLAQENLTFYGRDILVKNKELEKALERRER